MVFHAGFFYVIIAAMKPISNFHTHTYLCKHATGTPLQYVNQALKEGCSALGFSDHCPYPDSFEDMWPDIRMSTEEINLYLQMVTEAKESAPFPVLTGYECEWDARYKSWYEELFSSYGAQYLVLGSHWVTLNGGSTHLYCPGIDNNSDLNHYIDQTINGMRSGLFAFLAHPDLFMMGHKEWDEQAISCSKAIIDAASDLNLPLEINGLGITRAPNNTRHGMRYPYPYIEFWDMVKEKGNIRIICNSDSHKPEDVLMNAWRARNFASGFGFEVMNSTEILDVLKD